MDSEQLKQIFDNLNKITAGAVKSSGPRYTEVAHVDLEISKVFDGLLRNDNFKNRLLKAKGELGRAFKTINDENYFSQDSKIHEKFLKTRENLEKLNSLIVKLEFTPTFDPKALSIKDSIDQLTNDSETFMSELYSFKPVDRADFAKKHTSGKEYEWFQSYFRKFQSKLYELETIVNSESFKAYSNHCIWITSAAGFGKTHLLCDFSKSSLRKGQPVLFLLGNYFNDQNIWMQLCRKMKINADNPGEAQTRFLTLTKELSQGTNKKFALVIDALNEGVGMGFWPSCLDQFQTAIQSQAHIALVVSCRTTYEHIIKPSKSWLVVRHGGFENNIFLATKRYFESFGIVGHEIPLLGEFTNPLFLKTYCEAVEGKDARILRGHHGIKWIHEEYFKKIDAKIARRLGYPEGQLIAHILSKKIAIEMAAISNEWISFSRFSEIVNEYKLQKNIPGDFEFELLNEGLFVRDFTYDLKTKKDVESVRFGFQKFSDTFVVRALLGSANLTKTNMVSAFANSPAIKGIFERCYANKNLIEALAAEVPEYCEGKVELIELAKDMAPDDILLDATFDSLIWREIGAYPDPKKLRTLLGSAINSEEKYRRFIDTILAVSTSPGHPLNGDFLHGHLNRNKLPMRDARWLPFLHYAYDEGSVVTRMIDWAWTIDFATVSKESLDLYAGTLCWFFASSHRPLRDRATKALVLVISQVPELALKLLQKFISVDDDYVHERVLISAYGAFCRNRKADEIYKYSEFVYDYYFLKRNMPLNVSIRYYAKRTLMLAKELGWKKKLDTASIKPPYKSKWPSKISTTEELEKKYESVSFDSMNPHWSYNTIHTSVLSWGDFARYEIGTDHESRWVPKTFIPVAKKIENFKKNFEIKEERQLVGVLAERLGEHHTDSRFLELLNKIEESFLERMPLELKKYWRTEIKPFLKSGTEKPAKLPLNTIQRMIMDRIESMGYSVDLHGQFDRMVANGNSSRSANKPERIGKKYQWVAFFNVMGIVCDHYNYMSYDGFTDDPGMEEMRFIKHIDPTIALRSPKDIPNIAAEIELRFPIIRDWMPDLSESEWLEDGSDFFDCEGLVRQKDASGTEWLLLDGGYSFAEEPPPDEEKFDVKRRDIFYVINSCIFKKKDHAKVLKFLEKANYSGRWMPESSDQIDPHFAEFSFRSFRGELPDGKLCTSTYYKVPFKFSVTTEQYLYENGTHDCSMEETIRLTTPSILLSEQMSLYGKNFDGVFRSEETDDIIGFNLKEAEAYGFMLKKDELEKFLEANELGIFWSILSEKRMIGGRHNDSPGRHDLSSSVILMDGELLEIGRKASYQSYPKR